MSIKKLSILLALPAGLALAQNPVSSPGLPPTPVTLQEAEAAEQQAADMRHEADRLRAEAERQRQHDDYACYAKILVNACRDRVRKENIERMNVVRQLDIDANQIDRLAKARKVELDAMNKTGPKPTAKPVPPQTATSAPLPDATTVPPVVKPHTAPPENVSAASQAQAEADRQHRAERAEQARQQRNAEAAQRAQQARQDAARYAQREREHAEKMARKAAASAPQ